MNSRLPNLNLLRNWSLCTWNITYWLPDQPLILGPELVIQHEDLPPSFPELKRYLKFWETSIHARLHSIKVTSAILTTPEEFRIIGKEMFLH